MDALYLSFFKCVVLKYGYRLKIKFTINIHLFMQVFLILEWVDQFIIYHELICSGINNNCGLILSSAISSDLKQVSRYF